MENMNILLEFLLRSLLYLIPCVLGSTVSYLIKDKRRRGKKFKDGVSKVITYSLAPIVLSSAFHDMLNSKIGNSNIVMGVAFVCGMVGEEITKALSSINTIIQYIYKLKRAVSLLSDVDDDTGDKINELTEDHKKKK